MQPVNPLLANGQIATRLRINLAGANEEQQQQQQALLPAASPQHATIGTQFVSGQFSPAARFISQQLVGGQVVSSPAAAGPAPSIFKFPQEPPSPSTYSGSAPPTSYSSISDPNGSNEASVEHVLFKRAAAASPSSSKKHEKRALVQLTDGSVIDDSVIAANPFDFDGLAQFGAPAFQQELNKHMDIEDEIKQHDREPAEGEVQAVLQLCSACDAEPFKGAIIFAWKEARVQTKNTLKGKSIGRCGEF